MAIYLGIFGHFLVYFWQAKNDQIWSFLTQKAFGFLGLFKNGGIFAEAI